MLVRTPTGQKALLNALRALRRALIFFGTIEAGVRQRNGPVKPPKSTSLPLHGPSRAIWRPCIAGGFDFGGSEAQKARLPLIGSARSPLLQPDRVWACHGGSVFVAWEPRARMRLLTFRA